MNRTLVWAGIGLAAFWLYTSNQTKRAALDAAQQAQRDRAAYDNGPQGFFNSLGGAFQNGAGLAQAGAGALTSLTDLVKSFGLGNGNASGGPELSFNESDSDYVSA